MRIDSIHAINITEQKKHNSTQPIGTSVGRSSSDLSFKELLNAHIRQASTPTVSHQTENQLAGLLSGYLTQLKITQRDEAKPVSTAS